MFELVTTVCWTEMDADSDEAAPLNQIKGLKDRDRLQHHSMSSSFSSFVTDVIYFDFTTIQKVLDLVISCVFACFH